MQSRSVGGIGWVELRFHWIGNERDVLLVACGLDDHNGHNSGIDTQDVMNQNDHIVVISLPKLSMAWLREWVDGLTQYQQWGTHFYDCSI